MDLGLRVGLARCAGIERLMAAVAVVGAGAAGLTAAVALRRRGHIVTLFESDDRTGGVIQSVRQGGFLADLGPNSMLAPPPLVSSLLREYELQRERVDAARLARKRYVVRGGVPRPIPASPLSFLSSSLFSPSAKLRILSEPFRSNKRKKGEESLADLVRRRLGQEIVDYALNPMVGGIYAGDPEQLSAAHAMPSLGALETRYGSLVGGAIRMMKARRSEPGEPEGRLFSFRDGMAAIPDALAASLQSALHLGTRVVRLASLDRSWLVCTEGPRGPRRHLFDAVIWTAPSHMAESIGFDANERAQWRSLGQLNYSPVAVTVSGYIRSAVQHPLDGFGVLIPAIERRQTLGTLFSSTLFPERAPDGYVTLTTFTGGARQPEIPLAGESAVHQAVDADLRDLLGVQQAPVFRETRIYTKAIPQYNVGHGRYLERLDQLERANPGLYFAGSYRSGVAVAEVMTSGVLAAEAACAALGPAGVAFAGSTA